MRFFVMTEKDASQVEKKAHASTEGWFFLKIIGKCYFALHTFRIAFNVVFMLLVDFLSVFFLLNFQRKRRKVKARAK